MQLLDLGPGPLAHILRFATVQDISRAAQVRRRVQGRASCRSQAQAPRLKVAHSPVAQACKALREAAATDAVWRAKALELYPERTVRLGHYPTYRALVEDDNAHNASLAIPLADASCEYKHNRGDYFFECCLLELQWLRAEGVLRLFYDARGEADLRNPLESSLGATVHRGCPSRRALRVEAARLEATRAELQQVADRLAPQIFSDPEAASRHHSALRALSLTTTRLLRAARDLQEAPAPGFVDLLSVIRPQPGGARFLDAGPGHYRGYLQFEGLHRVDSLVAELPDSYLANREAARRGLDITFCFANPVPVMPHVSLGPCGPVRHRKRIAGWRVRPPT